MRGFVETCGRASTMLACTALIALWATAASAEDPAEFYRGKRITLTVDTAPGGGYDTYGRLVARFYGNHVPGQPQIVVQNMPGAGGLTAANWLANIAPKDGTAIEIMSRSIPLAPLMGTPGARFEPLALSWLGSMNREVLVAFTWAATGISRFEQLTERPVSVGVTGTTADSALFTTLSNNLLGTKLKIITGYPGSDAINLAVERGEIDMGTGSWSSIKARKPDWLRDNKINVLVQYGLTAVPELKGVPVIEDVTKDDTVKQVFELFLAPQEMGRPFAAPPDVPADRLKALRQAFLDTAKDPAFVDAAAKQKLDIDPISADDMTAILKRVYAMPPRIVERARQAAQQQGASKP